MRLLQKLVRNGNSTHLAIAKPLLEYLRWQPGMVVTVELQQNNTLVVAAAPIAVGTSLSMGSGTVVDHTPVQR